MAPRESSRPSRGHRPRDRQRNGQSAKKTGNKKRKSQGSRRPVSGSDETPTEGRGESRGESRGQSRGERSSKSLSAGALADLNKEQLRQKRREERAKRASRDEYRDRDRDPEKPRKPRREKKRRVVSGAIMEEGRASGLRGGNNRWSDDSLDKDFYQKERPKKSKKKLWILLGISVVLLIIIIVVAVVVSNKNKDKNSSDSSSSDSGSSSSSDLDDMDHADIPDKWQNSYLDPWTWASTTDFNVTFTDEMVGDLPVMGLNTEWDDSAQANDNVPALNKDWGSYADTPARGVCLGGWLSLEPFITPSLFNYDTKLGIIDEWTLSEHLGSDLQSTLEDHYASFVTEDTFKDIAAAGLDHVRIAYSYWAVQTYDGDPYLFRTSWRYLLRAIEWARKYGIRVNLDLHGIPGSQNGWNHSGRWGTIGWLNGTDGETNAQRALDIHNRLSKFFAQDRYKNIITHYGLANEPKMTYLSTTDVISWTESAYKLVRKNGMDALVIFGDGFRGLDNWQGQMTGYDDMVLDVHQYVIFNENQIDYTHQEKVNYACDGWSEQAVNSMDTSTGYGPTIFAEWSQADTDCAKYLTGVSWGNRWEGTYDTGNTSTSILTPRCPTKDSKCSCSNANADPSDWSTEYKKFLLMFAEAQMHSFEKGWGWWYWTWKTESASQWSYETGLKAGVLPEKAWERDFNCDSDVPDFEDDGLPEYY
ncbi:glycoside hydrolase superfamily [Dactylonectria estremocensis]|uniref:glucan 1,3-beta-glucosidase n=1 Tax=Dactylonectria estremocensis TaxID=1079267 RepID=A0A9P9FBD2_9HYPO|nr:glycoside hydrolase superfamily [Dactylonectria estremocensis]